MESKINNIIPSTEENKTEIKENNIREFNETPTKPLVPFKRDSDGIPDTNKKLWELINTIYIGKFGVNDLIILGDAAIKGIEKVDGNYLKLQPKKERISHKTQVVFNNLFAELKQRYCFIDCDKVYFFFI